MTDYPTCRCLEPQYSQGGWKELLIHTEVQDTRLDAWKRLLELIELAAEDGRETFSPASDLGWDDWWQIVTLPPTIAKLKAVKSLNLYGSALVRIPPEIGEMEALEKFEPYTSYRLHWMPFEITRCKNLVASCVSTRALYGNFKYRPPFPQLRQAVDLLAPKQCSICRAPFYGRTPNQRWISVRVATDVLPLLVHACSEACLDRLPESAAGYVSGAHTGGLRLAQPETRD